MWIKDYAGALTAFNNPELTTNYHLLPKFVNVGEYNNQNNDESLFEVQFNVYGSQSWDGGWNDGGEEGWIDDFSWPWEISGFGYDYGNPGLWYSYQAGDQRKYLTIVGPGDTLQSPGIIAQWGGIKGYAVTISNFAEASKPLTGTDTAAIILARQRYTTGINNIRTVANTNAIINTCGSVNYPWYGDDAGRSGYYNSKKWRDPTLTGATDFRDIRLGRNQILMRLRRSAKTLPCRGKIRTQVTSPGDRPISNWFRGPRMGWQLSGNAGRPDLGRQTDPTHYRPAPDGVQRIPA